MPKTLTKPRPFRLEKPLSAEDWLRNWLTALERDFRSECLVREPGESEVSAYERAKREYRFQAGCIRQALQSLHGDVPTKRAINMMYLAPNTPEQMPFLGCV